jgi:hypothetical protein
VYALWSYVPPLFLLKYGSSWKRWIENSRDPVHIHLYTGRELRKLFSPVEISLERYEFRYAPALQRWLGWFLVAKGTKPV